MVVADDGEIATAVEGRRRGVELVIGVAAIAAYEDQLRVNIEGWVDVVVADAQARAGARDERLDG
jgi:hypothetical protein